METGTFLSTVAAMIKELIEALVYGLSLFTRKRYTMLRGYVSLSGNGTGTITIQLPTESDCVVEKITSKPTSTSYTAQIQKTDEDRYLQDAQLPSDLLFANATQVNNGIGPFFCARGSKLVISLTDTSGSTNAVYLAAHVRYIG